MQAKVNGALGIPTPEQGRAHERYQRATPGVSVALALLAYWERPWSANAQRFAYHALRRVYALGLDVLEAYEAPDPWCRPARP